MRVRQLRKVGTRLGFAGSGTRGDLFGYAGSGTDHHNLRLALTGSMNYCATYFHSDCLSLIRQTPPSPPTFPPGPLPPSPARLPRPQIPASPPTATPAIPLPLPPFCLIPHPLL